MVAIFAAGATALMWRPAGLAAAIDLGASWLTGLAQTGATAWHWPLEVMVICEPLGFGDRPRRIDAGAWAQPPVRRFPRHVAPGGAAVGNGPARADERGRAASRDSTGNVGRYALEALGDSLRSARFSVEEGILLLVMLPVIAYFVLGLAANVTNPAAPSALTDSLASRRLCCPCSWCWRSSGSLFCCLSH